MDLASKPGPLGRLESFAHHYGGVCHPAGEAHTTRSSGEAWALDVDRHDRLGDHTAHGSRTGHAGLHVPHASGAISGCEPTGLCPRQRICCEFCSATEKQRNSDLLLPGVTL